MGTSQDRDGAWRQESQPASQEAAHPLRRRPVHFHGRELSARGAQRCAATLVQDGSRRGMSRPKAFVSNC